MKNSVDSYGDNYGCRYVYEREYYDWADTYAYEGWMHIYMGIGDKYHKQMIPDPTTNNRSTINTGPSFGLFILLITY